MSEERKYRIRPLEWHVRGMYHRVVVLDTCYEMWKAGDSPFRWQSRLRDQAANATFSADSLEGAKAACEAHWRARLAEVLEQVVVSKCWECGPFGHCIACGDVGVKIEPAGGPKEGK